MANGKQKRLGESSPSARILIMYCTSFSCCQDRPKRSIILCTTGEARSSPTYLPTYLGKFSRYNERLTFAANDPALKLDGAINI